MNAKYVKTQLIANGVMKMIVFIFLNMILLIINSVVILAIWHKEIILL